MQRIYKIFCSILTVIIIIGIIPGINTGGIGANAAADAQQMSSDHIGLAGDSNSQNLLENNINSVPATTDSAVIFSEPAVPSLTAVQPPDGSNMIRLDWSTNAVPGMTYMVHKSPYGEGAFQTIPLKTDIKVLNVYPDIADSDKLKEWMDAYGNPPGYSMIVDKIGISDFNVNYSSLIKDTEDSYKYDVLFFGSWDGNNGLDLSIGAKTEVDHFIDQGGGCLFGHDTANANKNPNFVALASKYMNMICNDTFSYYGDSNTDSIISVIKKGMLINYPWILPDTITVRASHSTKQFAMGDVWMKFNTNKRNCSLYTYYGGKSGTNNFYLTTWNNAAMIQTGHTSGSATVDEQKVLANTLFYLAQTSEDTEFNDHTAQDLTAPEPVNGEISVATDQDGKVRLSFGAASDNGTSYDYFVDAIDESGNKVSSTQTSATVTTGVSGYAVQIDKNPSSVDPGNSVNCPEPEFYAGSLGSGDYYAHIKAIDGAENVSSIATIPFTVDKTKTVTFETNGGSAVSPIVRDAGTYIDSLPVTSKAGMLFSGWYSDSDLTNEITSPYKVAGDAVLYAAWSPDPTLQDYTLTFSSEGGSPIDPITLIYNSEIPKPTNPVKNGYAFDGWWTGTGGTGTEVTWPYRLTNDTIIYAKWNANEISLPDTEFAAGTYGTEFSADITEAENGTGVYSYVVTEGMLPPGLLLSGTTISGIPESSGSYSFEIIVSDIGSGKAALQDYSITIDKRDITVVADNKSMVYGTAVPELTYTVTSGSEADGDSFTGALGWVVGDGDGDVGDYEINQGTLTLSENYDITPVKGTLTVTKATVSGISFTGSTFTYDGTSKSLYIDGTLPEGVTVSYEGNRQIRSGNYTVKAIFTVNENYNEIDDMTAALKIIRRDDNTNRNIDVIIDGNTVNLGSESISFENGITTSVIALGQQELKQAVDNRDNGTVITVSASKANNRLECQLNGQTVKDMEDKEARLEIETPAATYLLPAVQIDIDTVSEQLGTQVDLKDIDVQLEIIRSPEETARAVEDSARENAFAITVPPVEFSISCTYNNKTVAVERFKGYVERMIAIPEEVDHGRITTGVIVDADGIIRHVPTKVIVKDGSYYAKINSLTNSIYSVIWNPVVFKDAEGHWARDAVNDMGSRLIINGVNGHNIEPDRDITRAEFSSILVRALGLNPGTGSTAFSDVNASEEYSGYIETALKYKLISGFSADKFGPNEKVTREQALSMVSRAMSITGSEPEITANDAVKILSWYEDASQASSYSKSDIAVCIQAGIVNGKPGSILDPKGNITRAEAAVIIRRLLQKSNLI